MRIFTTLFLIIFFTFTTSCTTLNLNAETNIKYKTYNRLPCHFNNAFLTSSATPDKSNFKTGGPCCPNCIGYEGKKGTTIAAKRGTPVVAVTDMELIHATDASAEYHCLTTNRSHIKDNKKSKYKFFPDPVTGKKIKCRYPFDDVKFIFVTETGQKILYYHLMPFTPLVPGFGTGNCKPKIFYDRKSKSSDYCGGIKKTKVKKGEVIGYVGHATVDHISFNIDLGKGYLTNPESKIHGLLWENYPKNPNALLLPIILE